MTERTHDEDLVQVEDTDTDEQDPSAGLPADQARIGDQVIQLEPPASYAVRSEISRAAGDNFIRALAAALGACWRGKGGPKVRYERCGYDPLLYGGRVLDELVERGITEAEIIHAGARAFARIRRSLFGEPEVKAAEGFSGPGSERSTG